jgi:hypothetical protein
VSVTLTSLKESLSSLACFWGNVHLSQDEAVVLVICVPHLGSDFTFGRFTSWFVVEDCSHILVSLANNFFHF